MTDITIRKTVSRYELIINDEVAAFADYVTDGNVVELPHTVTNSQHRGKGLAGKLVTHILDELHDAEAKVLPTCQYVARFIDERPQYQQLVHREG
jgi:uncharacterized protein